MYTDATVLEPVLNESVFVGVVYEDAFFTITDDIAIHAAVIRVVEQQTVFAVSVRNVAVEFEMVGIHHRVADIVADGSVIENRAIIGVHEMHGETEIVKLIAADGDVRASHGKYAIATVTKIVIQDSCVVYAIDRDAWPALTHSDSTQSPELIVLHPDIRDAIEKNAHYVVDEPVIRNNGPIRPGANENAGLFCQNIDAGVADGEPMERNIRGGKGDRAALAFAVDDGSSFSFQR